VVNYVRAMNHGLRRLEELPVCLRLIREIHGELLQGVRGAGRRGAALAPTGGCASQPGVNTGARSNFPATAPPSIDLDGWGSSRQPRLTIARLSTWLSEEMNRRIGEYPYPVVPISGRSSIMGDGPTWETRIVIRFSQLRPR